MTSKNRLFVFREFLRQCLRPYTLGPNEDANLVGMRLYGEGPFHRELKVATRIAKKTHFVIRAGDVIYNKLFAWKGTFGIVPHELDGMFVSDKFPTYTLDRKKVSERYLRWYFRYSSLWEQAREKSRGSAALSKLTLNPPKFLDLTMTAPADVSEQDRIADKLDSAETRINDIRNTRAAAAAEVKVLSQSLISEVLKELPADGKLGEVLTGLPRNGWSPKCDNAEGGVAVLALGSVTGFSYNRHSFKRTSEPTEPAANYWLQPNDLLMTRSNTLEFVGHSAIYSGEPSPCIYPDLMMRLEINESLACRRFIWYWLQTRIVRHFIESKAKGTSPTMKKISQGVVAAIPFPANLSLPTQRHLVSLLDEKFIAVRMLQNALTWKLDEVDAVLSTLLQHEFAKTAE